MGTNMIQIDEFSNDGKVIDLEGLMAKELSKMSSGQRGRGRVNRNKSDRFG